MWRVLKFERSESGAIQEGAVDKRHSISCISSTETRKFTHSHSMRLRLRKLDPGASTFSVCRSQFEISSGCPG